MKSSHRSLILLFFLTVGFSAYAEEPTSEKISYYKKIRPILQAHCQGCHQPAKDKGDYIMTDFAKLLAGGDSGEAAIVPGKPEASLLVAQVTVDAEGHVEMPPKGDPLHETQVALIRQWIKEGAVDDTPENAIQKYDRDHPPAYSRPPVITSIDYSSDGKWLAVAGFHEALLFDADGKKLQARLIGLSERIESVRFSPDGKWLAVTGGLPARMGEVQIWDVATHQLKTSIPVTFDTVYGASWSPDSKLVALGGADNTLRVVEALSGKQVLYQNSHTDWVFDTCFSEKGTHVVSVGRDMTAKLNELATQRFVDNITSITPGALKGGIAAVDQVPGKDDIVFGGADGQPKMYRMFRNKARKIGDDFNLLRKFEAMKGRVFGIDISNDAKVFVAGSSLDGEGVVRLYDLSIEKPRWSVDVDTSIYAVALTPDASRVAATGADGQVRFFQAADGKALGSFSPAPLSASMPEMVSKLIVEPSSVEIVTPVDYAQMVVLLQQDGALRDVTREVSFGIDAAFAKISSNGMLTPKGDGNTALRIKWGDLRAEIPVKISGQAEAFTPDYIHDVTPVLSKLGCNQGTCHGAKDGKNGFKLSLRGYDPIYDVRAFTDDLGARRINFASPDDSLMLLKATAGVPHEGGQLTKPGETYYRIIRDWIAHGAKLDMESPRVSRIALYPENPTVQNIGDSVQFRIVATYADGRQRDVSSEAFIETANGEVVETDKSGLAKTIRRGEAPILARFEGAYAVTTVTVMGDRSGFAWKQMPVYNKVDEFVDAKLKRMKILPSDLCTDAEFVRRIHLDLTGLPPTSEAVKAFLADKTDSRKKREALIDTLIGNDDYVDFWSNKWADLLQVNRKFLGPEGARLFRDWIRNEVAANTPYDQFSRKVLTATGSNKANPPASYFKILRTPEDIMENTTHLFLATRFNCNKCHDHPFERWTQDQYYEMAAYFAQVELKKAPEAGDKQIGKTAVEAGKPLFELISDKKGGDIKHERTGAVTPPAFPYSARHDVAKEASRREQLAAWMTSADNQYFARSYVNRVFGYLTGTGIIEPLDDIRAGNPPSNPELLDWLTSKFVESGFDVRQLMNVICKSRTYQLSIVSNKWNEDDAINYSHAKARRLPAEVLYDSIYAVVGSQSKFPGVPVGTRAAALPDVGVKLADGFLGNLGRPNRETSCECERSNELQLGPVMALVSGPTVGNAISDGKNALPAMVSEYSDDRQLINELYVRVLSRPATEQEVDLCASVLKQIDADHQVVTDELKKYEASYAQIKETREADRVARIKALEEQLASHREAIAPERAKLEKARADKVAAEEKKLRDYEAAIPGKIAGNYGDGKSLTIWHPVQPAVAVAQKATLKLESNQVVFAEGTLSKDVYTIEFETDINNITGLQLEALTDDRLPGKGPGRPENGNFVVSEIKFFTTPVDDPKKRTEVKFKDARATFSQQNYEVKKAFNNVANDGWAISPQMGKNQTAVFMLKDKVNPEGKVRVIIEISNQHSDNKHVLGKFRLSLTNSGKVDLAPPMEIVSIAKIAEGQRTPEQAKQVFDYFVAQDAHHRNLVNALNVAKRPVPENAQVTQFNKRIAEAKKPLGEDPVFARLKRTVELSTQQLGNKRLTAAQDIAWALINNPAFLFNR